VQRVVEVGDKADYRLAAAVRELWAEPTMLRLRFSPTNVLIVNRSDESSEAWMKTARNRDKFEAVASRYTSTPKSVNFLVTINDSELRGLAVDSLRPHFITDEISAEEQDGLFSSPKGIFSSPPVRAQRERLSLETVLLHELAHVVQNLDIPKEQLKKGVDTLLQPPDATILINAAVSESWTGGYLRSPIWSMIRATLNAINGWVSQAKGYLYDKHATIDPPPPSQDVADKIIELIERAQLEVGLWIEYDVIANVEHPYAAKRNEPIRTLHGEEEPLTPKRTRLVFDINAHKEDPSKLSEVKSGMIERTQTLTYALPFNLLRIYALYQDYAPAATKSLAPIMSE
jgi:hypothetical protein